MFGLSPRTLFIVIIQSCLRAVKPLFSNAPSVVSTCIGLGSFFSQPVLAQQNALEPIVITASKFSQPAGKVLADVTVINAQQIESSAALTLAQLLAQLGGAEIAETGGVAKSTGLFLRGTKTAQTIILIDGRRIENASSGGGALEFISLSSIDRIEIVRGPVSSLYGSGGIGGVIQIFTKNQIQISNVRTELGTQGHRLISAGTGFKQGDVNFSVNVSHQQTNGFDATLPTSPDAQSDKDGSKQNGANLSASWQIVRGHVLDWSASANQGNTLYDSAFSKPNDTSLKFSHWNTGATYRAQLNDAWKSEFKWSRSLISNEYAAFTFAPHASTQVLAWENSLDLKQVLQGLKLLAGIEKQDQTVKGPGVEYSENNRQTRSVFAGFVLDREAHQFRLHARSDRLSTTNTALNYAGQTSYSVAYGYQLTPQWLVSASTGTAFRAPTFDDLFSPYGGNLTLKPERSRSSEVLVKGQFTNASVSAALFNQTVRDAIELDPNFVPQNLDRSQNKGLALQASLAQGALSIQANLTFQNPRGLMFASAADGSVQNTERARARRARQHGAVTVAHDGGAWRNCIAVAFQGARTDADQVTRLPAYSILNVSSQYKFNKALSVDVRLHNLLDKQYQTAAGYRSAARTILVGLQWQAL